MMVCRVLWGGLPMQVSAFKVNTEDVFKRWSKTMADLKEEIQTLQIQKEEVRKLHQMKKI